uniref:Cation/H+ exchanger protein 2 n=1 Tax=Ornithorhynchus anatinus TaxID=9258 RepID=F6ZCH7_ORNAN
THAAFLGFVDFHQELECPLEVRHRCGSLCDQRRAIDNTQARFVHSSEHQHGILTPRILPGESVLASPVCCHHQSDENLESSSYRLKTTILAENEVEANKLSNNYKFGFKKWKSHVTARPWEDRSEITKELYSDLCVVRSPAGSTVTCGNVFYLLLFGWWVSSVYLLVSVLMFLSVLGAPYGKLCWSLAGYFLWPFGKVIQKVWGSSTLLLLFCLQQANQDPLPDEGLTKPGVSSPRQHRVSTYIWLLLGFPILVVTHVLVCCCSWLLVVIIPIAKMSVRTVTRVLLEAPEQVHVQSAKETEISPEGDVLLCCYRATNAYYYKYSVDGINVFAVNLLPLVIVTLVLGYMDSQNQYTSSLVKFTLSLLSIMPLSYYIGMAIASISAQSTFAVGAVVNATFGSVIELTFYITALIKGAHEGSRCYEEVVKAALTGTVLGCTLLVPVRLPFIPPGLRRERREFPDDSRNKCLTYKKCGGILWDLCQSLALGLPLLEKERDLVENNGTLYYSHVQPLVYTVSLLLPFAYLIGLFFTLKTHSHIYDIHVSDLPGHHHRAVVHWPRWRALLLLLLSTCACPPVPTWPLSTISPILESSTVSQYFIGVTVLAMVPELPEIINGSSFSLLCRSLPSIEIGNCIAVQVCMLQIPILVLFSIFYPTGFKLLFSDLHVYASMFSVILMNYIFMDGKCDYFQGTVLVMVYLILLAVYFFAPSPAGC